MDLGKEGFRVLDARESPEHESDVLAHSQIVDLEVTARAIVIPGVLSPDGDLVTPLRYRIGHHKIGENRMIAPVFQTEVLLLPILFSEQSLPFFELEAFRLVSPRYGHTKRFFRPLVGW